MIQLSALDSGIPIHEIPVQPMVPHTLANGDVHVWRIDLDSPGWRRDNLLELMSPDEIERADRYVFAHDRDRFIAARGMLRMLLASYTGIPATEILFDYNAHGKPRLAAGGDLAFNLSHSHAVGLVAVAPGRQVGVDIERIRPEIDVTGLAQSTFSANEWTRLANLPEHQQLAGFYACWTRKEAYIKARGEGLSYPLEAFDVSLEPGVPSELLRSAEGLEEIERWTFVPIEAPSGYATALVVESPLDSEQIETYG